MLQESRVRHHGLRLGEPHLHWHTEPRKSMDKSAMGLPLRPPKHRLAAAWDGYLRS